MSLAAVLPLVMAFAPAARADDAATATPPPSSQSSAVAALGVQTGPDPAEGLPIAGFLVYPSLFAGVIYNDNIYPTQDDHKAALGFAFAPNLTAIADEGLHTTTLTLNADVEIYPGHTRAPLGVASPAQVSGGASLQHVWTPAQDLTIDVAAGFIRKYGLFGSLLAAGSDFVSGASAANVATYPQFSNQFSGCLRRRGLGRRRVGGPKPRYASRIVRSLPSGGIEGRIGVGGAESHSGSIRLRRRR